MQGLRINRSFYLENSNFIVLDRNLNTFFINSFFTLKNDPFFTWRNIMIKITSQISLLILHKKDE
ncbi:hypothetical protein BpHYR1_036674 [Brachionus plicatilis]|uniref:Uncharacterized protein n=1 Tax=Brachionus plicatilis TaxID=10195 RepID=A0A3M7P3Q4_BRAPC|nr:hypothetical protein BpHYR1_036674 [Brachionus plicatilis]